MLQIRTRLTHGPAVRYEMRESFFATKRAKMEIVLCILFMRRMSASNHKLTRGFAG
jgi:hypothetical protein